MGELNGLIVEDLITLYGDLFVSGERPLTHRYGNDRGHLETVFPRSWLRDHRELLQTLLRRKFVEAALERRVDRMRHYDNLILNLAQAMPREDLLRLFHEAAGDLREQAESMADDGIYRLTNDMDEFASANRAPVFRTHWLYSVGEQQIRNYAAGLNRFRTAIFERASPPLDAGGTAPSQPPFSHHGYNAGREAWLRLPPDVRQVLGNDRHRLHDQLGNKIRQLVRQAASDYDFATDPPEQFEEWLEIETR